MQNITVILDECTDNHILGVLVVDGHSMKEVQEQFHFYKTHKLDSWTIEDFVEYLSNKKQWIVCLYNEVNTMVV